MWFGATAAEHLHRRRRWSVHSVFDSSANLRLEPDAPSVAPALIHVGALAVEAPFGINLPEPVWPAWRRYLHGTSRHGRLVRGEWDPAAGRFTGAATLTLGPSWRERVGDSTVPASTSVSPSALLGHPSPAVAVLASGIVMGSDAANVLDRLRIAFDGLLDGRVDAATWLLGRGPGLTPSGDDILIGMLGALHRAALPARSADAAAALHRLLDTSEPTTDVSAAYLRDACRGRFAAPLRRVLLASTPAETVARLTTLRAIGHTSGADTILGLAAAADRLRGVSLPSARTTPHTTPQTTASRPWAA